MATFFKNNFLQRLLMDVPERPRSPPRVVFVERKKDSTFKKILNIVFIILVALTWSLSTQFGKSALTLDPTQFNAAFLLMWFNTNFMIFCFPAYVAFQAARNWKELGKTIEDATKMLGNNLPLGLVTRVFPFLILWVIANFAYTLALVHVAPSIATSISASNTAVVYLLSLLLLQDRLNIFKILSVALAIGGVIVTSFTPEAHAQILGVVLCVASAISAAVYKVCFKKMFSDSKIGQVAFFMTCLGLMNLVICGAITVVLLLTNMEIFNIKTAPYFFMVISGLLSLAFNFLINFGISMFHPLSISVGMLCGIPINTTLDIIFRGLQLNWLFVLGAVLIILSVVFSVFDFDKLLCKKKPPLDSNTRVIYARPDLAEKEVY